MAGLTLQTIREALADQLRDALSAGGRKTNVYPYRTNGTTPSITIDPAADYLDYFVTFGAAGLSTVRLTLEIIPASTEAKSAGIALDDYLSAGTDNPASIMDALYADTSLGGVAETLQVTGLTVDPLEVTASMELEITIAKIGAQA